MIRVGIAGIPSTGKTSLARALSGFCITNQKFSKVELISEAAREYISRYGSIDSIADEYLILESQIDWENRYSEIDLMITDSPINLIGAYAQYLKRDGNVKDTLFMEKIWRKINNLGTRYDIIFYLPYNAFKPVKDGVRPDLHLDDSWRDKTDRMIRSTLEMFPPKKLVEIKEVSLYNRVGECMENLKQL